MVLAALYYIEEIEMKRKFDFYLDDDLDEEEGIKFDFHFRREILSRGQGT